MYEFSDHFLHGDVAIIIPQEHFADFLESCIAAEIPDSDDEYQRTWAETRYNEGCEIFANVQFGEYLNFYNYNPNVVDDYYETCGGDIISWDEALSLRHIERVSYKNVSDIMELL